MIYVKKILLSVGLTVIALVGFSESSFAMRSVSKLGSKEPFPFGSEIRDSDSLLIMPDGSLMHGIVNISSADDVDTVIATYNSDTDPEAITVGELKKKWNKLPVNVPILNDSLFGSAPPTHVETFVSGREYTSNAFSGKGWHLQVLHIDLQQVAVALIFYGEHTPIAVM